MKKKIASSVLALSLAFNMAFVNVYAEDGTDIEDVVVGETTTGTGNGSGANLGDVTDVVVTLDGDNSNVSDGMVVISGKVEFNDDVFKNANKTEDVGRLKFVSADDTHTVEIELKKDDDDEAKFTNVSLKEETTYNITLLVSGGYTTGYSINNSYTSTKKDDDDVELKATKDSDNSTEKVAVSGSITFVSAENDDLKDYSPKLVFSADGQDTVTADLKIADNRMGYFSNIELVNGVAYNISLTGIDSYEIAKYGYDYDTVYTVDGADNNFSRDAKVVVEDDTNRKLIQVTGIVTFTDAEFDENSFDQEKNIVFKPTKGGDTKSVKLEYKGTTTATYDVYLLNNKEYKVTITDVDGYTLSETFTTPNETGTQDFTATAEGNKSENEFEKDEDGNLTVTTPSLNQDETFGDKVSSLKGTIESLPTGVTATLSPISNKAEPNDTSLSNTIETIIGKIKNQTSNSETTYSSPLVMFDLSLQGNEDKEQIKITIEFEEIDLVTVDGNSTTFLELFHFNDNNSYDIIDADWGYNNNNTAVSSVTFTTDDFSPFAIAQGYSTVKITQNNSDSSSSGSSSVSAVGSDGTTYYVTGNIPTVGFISQLRGVTVGEFINLDKITVTGKTIIGWFYDREFTKQVEDTANFVITQDIMDNGIYPQFEVVVDTLGASVSTYTPDYSSTPVYSTVPSTGVAFGARLF